MVDQVRLKSSPDELQALRDAVRAVLAARSGEPAIRAAADSVDGFDRSVWQLLSSQLGLPGLLAPTSHGGSGAGFEELAVVLAECGRTLYPGPVLASALALDSLVHGDSDGDDVLMQALATGEILGTAALDLAGSSCLRVEQGRLTGSARFVLAGAAADTVVAIADDAVWHVRPGASGVTVEPVLLVDPTRRLAHVSFDGTPVTRLSGAAGASRLRSAACVGIAAEQVGGAEASLQSAIAYAKLRTQFGQTIGSFQSLKHRCAEVFLQVESGRAAVERAARSLDEHDGDEAVLAAIAKAWCSDAYTHAVESSLQIHGGIGFTWEHVTHFHLKRAKTSELLFGDSRYHRQRIAAMLGL